MAELELVYKTREIKVMGRVMAYNTFIEKIKTIMITGES